MRDTVYLDFPRDRTSIDNLEEIMALIRYLTTLGFQMDQVSFEFGNGIHPDVARVYFVKPDHDVSSESDV
jgi:hypothetical protein